MSRREKYVAGFGLAAIVVLIGLIIAGSRLSHRIEPYIRDQAEQYLRDRFRADVQIASLRVQLPTISPLTMLFTHGRGTVATVDRRRHRHADARPSGCAATVRHPEVRHRDRCRPAFRFAQARSRGHHHRSRDQHSAQRPAPRFESRRTSERREAAAETNPSIIIDRLDVKQATLILLPKDKAKQPLQIRYP